jgi:thiol-disulfide isomerase/thioredoxin
MPSLVRHAFPLSLLAVLVGVAACRPAADTTPPEPAAGAEPAASDERAPVVMVGPLEREAVQRELPHWVSDAELDADAVKRLASVPPGAEVVIYFGTWCGDSRREVPRLWKAFDAAGALPFSVTLHGVDEEKTAPPEIDLRYVPTFIVRRDGVEVGRIVESAPEGVERELVHLLEGTKKGLVTARTDLGPSS